MNMEQITGLIVSSALLTPVAIIGLFLCCGKGADLIAGYNGLSTAERAKWNEKALCRGTGVLVLLMVGCIELTVAGGVLDVPTLIWGGLVLLAVLTVGGLIYINKSARFKR